MTLYNVGVGRADVTGPAAEVTLYLSLSLTLSLFLSLYLSLWPSP